MSLGISLDSAVQCVSLGKDIALRLKEFGKDGPDAPQPFRKLSATLPIITKGFERIQTQLVERQSDPNTPEIHSFLDEALRDIKRLHDCLERALPKQGTSRLKRSLMAVKSVFREDEIMGISRNLEHYMVVWQHIERTWINATPRAAAISRDLWNVPSSRNRYFSGREDILSEMEILFESFGVNQPRVALCGLGGIGKTQIAIEYCHRKRQSAADFPVFWVNAASISRFEESLRRIAGVCGVIQSESSESDVAAMVKAWLESQFKTPWLMVIDNVDDKDAFFEAKTRGGYSCMECIPKCQHGSLLFTTRSYEVAVDLADGSKPVEVPAMPREAGTAFIHQRLGADGSESEDDMKELLEALDNIPLAITQALSLIIKRKWTIRQYIDRYSAGDENKTRLLTYEFRDHTRETNSLESVVKTWILSFNSIERENRRAEDIMFLMSFLQNQSIPQAVLKEAVEGELEFEDALECLISFSFLERNVSGSFRTHRLVQLATKLYLREQSSTAVEDWAFKTLEAVSRTFPDIRSVDDATYTKDCETLMPHVESVLAATISLKSGAVPRMAERARLLRNSGRYFFHIGHDDEAIRRLEESFEICKRCLGENDLDFMDSAGVLGWGYLWYGKLTDAQAILGRVLNNRKAELGEDDPRTIDCLSDLAVSLSESDPERSELLQREAYQRSLRVLGPSHADTINCIQHLGDILSDRGNFRESEKFYREAVDITRVVLGYDSLSTITAEHDLATLLNRTGVHSDEAEELYRISLSKSERNCGFDHSETLRSAHSYAIHLRGKGSLVEAQSICERALTNAAEGLRTNVSRTQTVLGEIRDLLGVIEAEITPNTGAMIELQGMNSEEGR